MEAFSALVASNTPSDSFYNFATEKAHIALTTTSCILSILGCLIIFTTYFMWKDIRSSSRKILVYITLADFITVITYLVALNSPNYRGGNVSKLYSDKLCLAVGIVSTFSMISSFLWTLSLAVYLYIAVAKSNVKFADKLVLLFHIICWGIPLIVTLLASTQHMIGFDEDFVTSGWCWVKVNASNDGDQKPPTSTLLWMLLAGKGWEILAFVSITVIYFLIRYHMWLQVQDRTSAMSRDARNLIQRANRKMTWIPAVFLFLRIWGTLRFVLFATGVDNTLLNKESTKSFSKALLYLQGVGDCGQGWANCILFCLFTNKVFERLKVLCCRQNTQTKKHSSRKNTKHKTDSLRGVASSPTTISDHHQTYYNEESPLINNGTSLS